MSAGFEVGSTYSTTAIGDHTLVYAWIVVARTAKFMTITDRWGTTSKVGIKTGPDGEWALPAGSFSMCPVIRAERAVASTL